MAKKTNRRETKSNRPAGDTDNHSALIVASSEAVRLQGRGKDNDGADEAKIGIRLYMYSKHGAERPRNIRTPSVRSRDGGAHRCRKSNRKNDDVHRIISHKTRSLDPADSDIDAVRRYLNNWRDGEDSV